MSNPNPYMAKPADEAAYDAFCLVRQLDPEADETRAAFEQWLDDCEADDEAALREWDEQHKSDADAVE